MIRFFFDQILVRSTVIGFVELLLVGGIMFEPISGQQADKLTKALPTPDDSEFIGYSDQMFDDQFRYEFCFWPLLRGLVADSCNKQLEESFAKFREARGIDNFFGRVSVSTIAAITPKCFQSEYRLVFIRSYANMLGGGPPVTAMMAKRPDSSSFFCLDTTSYRVGQLSPRSGYNPDGSLWDPDNSFALDFVGNDVLIPHKDSINYLDIAFDAVTVSSKEHPLVILNDVYDVFEFSNSVKGEKIWLQMQGVDRDTLITLLTSLRIFGIRGNTFLDGNYETAFYPLADFDEYADIVRAPMITKLKDGLIRIDLFTWSPECGCLREWSIEVLDSGRLHISNRLITEMLGFYFVFG